MAALRQWQDQGRCSSKVSPYHRVGCSKEPREAEIQGTSKQEDTKVTWLKQYPGHTILTLVPWTVRNKKSQRLNSWGVGAYIGNDQSIDKQGLEHMSSCMRKWKVKDTKKFNLSEKIVLDKHMHIHTQTYAYKNTSTHARVYTHRHAHRHLSVSGQKYLDKMKKTSANVPLCGCPIPASVRGQIGWGFE